jgi:hypothetical protein
MQISYEVSFINPIIGRGIICREKIKKGTTIWLSNRCSYDDISHCHNPISEADYLFSSISEMPHNINVITFNENNLEHFLHTLSLSSKEKVIRFLDLSYGVSGEIHYIMDDGKFMNHSSEPNCITNMKDATTIALRDIEIGEILTEDYSTYSHPDYLKNILKKYNCEPDYYSMDK